MYCIMSINSQGLLQRIVQCIEDCIEDCKRMALVKRERIDRQVDRYVLIETKIGY